MIQFDKATKVFGGEVVLDALTFKVNKGERCALVGRNGSGKTTILRIITGEEKLDEGSIEMPKEYSLGYLSQHLRFTKQTLIEEAAQNLPSQAVYKVQKILFGLGFKEKDLTADPLIFSGGYQLRIHLAKVLVAEPDCLLLDEPTNYLDIVSIRWIARFLKTWPGELILISHDRDFIDQVTTHTLGIHRKKIKKLQGGTQKFYERLLQEEEVHERTRLNLEKKRQHVESFITRFGAKATKASQAQSRQKQLARMPVLEELAKIHHLDFRFPYAPFPGKRLLEAKGIGFSYEKAGEKLISEFDLAIDKGERIAIVGKNGRGKSTLLRLLAQELKPQEGSVNLSPNVKIGFFGQSNIERLHPEMTVEEEIAAAAPDLSSAQVRKICGIMMFSGDLAKKPIRVLSGGERSRVLLGKILAAPCNLLLLDEPTNHLDMESIEALMGALDLFEGSIVLVSHSEMILNNFGEKFVVCHQSGQHLFLGDYDQFLKQEGWEKETGARPTKPKQNQRDELKRLKREIASVERRIVALEGEVEEQTSELLKATEEKKFARLNALSKRIDEKKMQIEHLFNELEQLYDEIK
ncbi:MAG: ABC-F family ATP-binding cassette domain-containing protein [Chlamydiales bacterium]|nr:ABC-F family ATP-binding cassette domain-containing protein [Chlamydiales bacterium]